MTLLSRLRTICSRLSLLTDSHWSSMRAYWDQSGMGYGMDIRIQLLPSNEVPQESAKTRPGISDLGAGCVHVSVLAPLPAVGADTLTGNISNICHQLPILPHTTAHSSLQLQSSISTKEMKTRLEFYMHRAIHHLPASLSCWFKKVERKISSKSSLDSP